ncbi:MAG: trypsin-like peptidase domain-containing protein [Bacteroidota bacterium]
MKKFVGMTFSAVMGGLVALGIFIWVIGGVPDAGLLLDQNSQLVNETVVSRDLTTIPANFTKAASVGMPAVVHIQARETSTVTRNRNQQEDQSMELFREFFGDDFNFGSPFGQVPREGSGSGVIISKDGYIVTNNHVVEFANEIDVTLFDKRKYKAELVGTDPNTDLAVLKIEGNGLPNLNFADSDKTKVGEWVLAVGNPFDLTSTVTAGIISAKARSIDILGGGAAIESFIQTDAAVNPGNSGGALIDVEGGLIGINTAIMTRTGMFQGYSFAVPANIVEKVVDDLIQFGSTQRGFIGVNIRDLDAETANELGINIVEGVHVVSLVEDGAAIKAGVLPDDVITAVNGKNIKSAPELQEMIGRMRPGDIVLLDINRLGENHQLSVQLKK